MFVGRPSGSPQVVNLLKRAFDTGELPVMGYGSKHERLMKIRKLCVPCAALTILAVSGIARP